MESAVNRGIHCSVQPPATSFREEVGMFGGLLSFLGKKPTKASLDLGELKYNKKARFRSGDVGIKKVDGGSDKAGDNYTSMFFKNASYTPSGKGEEDEISNSASKMTMRTRSSSKSTGKENSSPTKTAKKRRHKSDTVNRELIKTRRRLSSSM